MCNHWRAATARAGCKAAVRSLLLCVLMANFATAFAQAGGAPLSLRWQLEPSGGATPVAKGSIAAAFTLTNSGPQALAGQDWGIYFNCMMDTATGAKFTQLRLERVTGPLYRLRPTQSFVPLRPGQSLIIPLVHPDALVNAALAPEGPYLVFDATPEKALAIINYEIAPFPAGYGTTPEQIYARNAALVPVAKNDLPPVFPTPLQYERHAGLVSWSTRPRIIAAAQLRSELTAAQALIQPYFSRSAAGADAPPLNLSVGPIPGRTEPEAYELTIDPQEGVTLIGVSEAGVARGLASLRQLLPAGGQGARGVALPAMRIRDAPRFAYRGLMLDVARNFQPKSEVLRVLELMSRYKLNTLHFHLTDDEGWRIEIPGLPELTGVGSRRGYSQHQDDRLPPAYGSGPDVNNRYGSGYYTRADYIEILRYAAARHIEVIPEIEMPGHARAAVVSMAARARRLAQTTTAQAEQYLLADPEDKSVYESAQAYTDNVMNPGLPSTYVFIEHVASAMVALHRAAGVPLRTLHVGGDELPQGAWERSPACKALMGREHLKSGAELWNYFYTRVGKMLTRRGVALAGWEEVGAHTVELGGRQVRTANPAFSASGYTLYVWRNTEGAEDLADRLANAGYRIVLTPATRLYFDHTPYPHPLEPGQNWAGYVDLDTVFDYVPDDDTRLAPDDPRRLANREALTKAGRERIRGLEGALFSETVHEPTRLDYMLMPRVLALAERAWAPEPAWTKQPDRAHAAPLRAQAWSVFAKQLGLQVLPRVDADHGALYRIAAPGLKRDGGSVLVNEQYPGFSLRYTMDGSEPNAHSPQVNGPVKAKALIRVAAFDRNGRAGRSSQLDNR